VQSKTLFSDVGGQVARLGSYLRWEGYLIAVNKLGRDVHCSCLCERMKSTGRNDESQERRGGKKANVRKNAGSAL
jgi:hypothetical protein